MRVLMEAGLSPSAARLLLFASSEHQALADRCVFAANGKVRGRASEVPIAGETRLATAASMCGCSHPEAATSSGPRAGDLASPVGHERSRQTATDGRSPLTSEVPAAPRDSSTPKPVTLAWLPLRAESGSLNQSAARATKGHSRSRGGSGSVCRVRGRQPTPVEQGVPRGPRKLRDSP